MTTVGQPEPRRDDHAFCMFTFTAQREVVDYALKEAKSKQDSSLPDWKAGRLARNIAEEVIRQFRQKLETEFPQTTYASLIKLTTSHRNDFFYGSLRWALGSIILGKEHEPLKMPKV